MQKGYVSVLDGPGGMGGAINLVTRKPTEPFEAEVRTGFSEGERDAYAMLGYAPRRFLRSRQRELFGPRLLGALRRLRADGDRGWRPAQRLRQSRRALQRQGRLHAERRGRVLGELHGANRRERRAAARLQQPAESAEQLLALADMGHRQSVLAIEHAARRRRRRHAEDEGVLQHVRELAVRVRQCDVHDAVVERPVPKLLRRRGLWRQRRSRRTAWA